jgi:hypothetical protein
MSDPDDAEESGGCVRFVNIGGQIKVRESYYKWTLGRSRTPEAPTKVCPGKSSKMALKHAKLSASNK